jgi:DNA uptake protein ComE-like DNA-binding protein
VLLAGCAPESEPGTELTTDTAAVLDTVAGAAPAAATGGMLDPDQASREELAALPGMTPQLADSLVARRPFATMLALDSVLAHSLDETQRDTLYTRLWKPLDLNTAGAAEIELIPGVGPRMRHEFEEYRPWTDLAHFRREIGKYVDEAEVARLERYVTIR